MGKKSKQAKISKEKILQKMNFNFSRDAEWFKKTNKKIQQVKDEINKNFYSEERKKQKLEFINKLKSKIKDYLDAIKFESRYKKIRFVERRKLERKLTQVNNKLNNNPDDQELINEKNKIIDDINYVKFYPKTYKYYALFPNKDQDNQVMIEKRNKMRQKIQQFLNLKEHKKKHDLDDDDDEEEENNKEEQNDNDNSNNNDVLDEEEEEDNEKNKDKIKSQNKNKSGNNNDIYIHKGKDNNIKKDKKMNNPKKENKEKKQKKVFKDPFFEVDEE